MRESAWLAEPSSLVANEGNGQEGASASTHSCASWPRYGTWSWSMWGNAGSNVEVGAAAAGGCRGRGPSRQQPTAITTPKLEKLGNEDMVKMR